MNRAGDPLEADGHVGESAELYALGALESDERLAVETHVALCAGCARALGDAEATVTALDEAFVPQLNPPSRLAERISASARTVRPFVAPRTGSRAPAPVRAWYATAAALLLAAGFGGGTLIERSADDRQAEHESAVLATIATSHFNHVTFTPRDTAAPVSKVLFARDGAWFYVVVDSATCHCRVTARSAAGERDLGSPQVRGSTATLFVRDVPRPSSLALVDESGRVLSDATLAYTKR